ncbi:hypothetical protein KGM_210412 [Danaus plexippus plexippus]|uniref:Uncharacterized protein n=1 Tax=Danaus plexippus plexippus TaxID=278856 RepID=A0A212EU75_DANPL|nr:hypothetical protein KGM_210412 [Danaus plexippus plexippus]
MAAKAITVCIFVLLCISSISTSPAPAFADNTSNQIIASGEVSLIAINENTNNGHIELNHKQNYIEK